MISTQDYRALPDAGELQRISKALAVLDAINSPEWEYRYYSYQAAWGQGEEAMTMRNGSGDELLILFRAEGCAINGLMHEYEQPDKAQLTRGLPALMSLYLASPSVPLAPRFACGTRPPTAGKPGHCRMRTMAP